MAELNINRLTNRLTAKTDYSAKKTEKKSDVVAAENTGKQQARSVSEQPLEKRIDTLIISEQARIKATKQVIGAPPQRSSGESDEHWMKRLISYETANAWRTKSREWKEESRDMGVVAGIRYQGQKATEWVTDLMENEPAMFREWLNREAWHLEEGDLDNAILPKGFTKEDMARWMEKDVLEYL